MADPIPAEDALQMVSAPESSFFASEWPDSCEKHGGIAL